jgi:hypothetical protein
MATVILNKMATVIASSVVGLITFGNRMAWFSNDPFQLSVHWKTKLVQYVLEAA